MSPKDRHYLGDKENGTPGAEAPDSTPAAASPDDVGPVALAPGEFLGEDGHVYRRIHEPRGDAWIDRTELVR